MTKTTCRPQLKWHCLVEVKDGGIEDWLIQTYLTNMTKIVRCKRWFFYLIIFIVNVGISQHSV